MRRIVLYVLAALAIASGRVRAEEPVVRFTDTPAARFFQAGRYDEALTELLRLREANPDHPLVLRYLAMTYDRMGRYKEALRLYVQALARDPENIALLYHSGETLYNARYADDARRHFSLVLSLDPGGPYAPFARAYLDALNQQRVARQAPGAPRQISLYVELGYARDDYRVPGADGEPDSHTRNDRITEYVSAEWNLVRRRNWLASVDVSGYGAQYVRNKDDARDIWQGGFGGTLQRGASVGGVPVVGTLRAQHQEVRFDGGPDYSQSDTASLGFQIGLTSNAVTRLHYRYTSDRFEEDGFDPAFSSRDADVHVVALQQTFYFLDGNAWLTASASYLDNQAEGRNYDYDGVPMGLSLNVPLRYGVRLDAGYEYTEEVYRNFAGPTRRETERHEWSASLYRWVGRSVLVRLRYAQTDEDSTIPGLSFDRTGIGMSVAYVY